MDEFASGQNQFYDNGDMVQVTLGAKTINLHFDEIETDIDTDQYTRIDYSNIYGELITVPVLMNRVGLMRAEAQSEWSRAKMALDIMEADRSAYYRKAGVEITGDKRKNPTVAQVEASVKSDGDVIKKRKAMIRKEKEFNYLDSLYWAVKSKDSKLNKISESMNLSPEEFEKNILEGRVNGIMIKKRKNVF